MKNLITSVFLLLALLWPAAASAYDFEVDGIYYKINGNEASVTNGGGDYWNYESYSGDVTIPDSVTYDGTTYLVTGISHAAFYGCSNLTSVSIPNTVIVIEGSVFSDCSGLTSIKVDSGNPKYDSRDNCNAIIETASNTLIAGCMTTVIPNSVTSIGERAFIGCSSLTSVTIPNSVISIGEQAFQGCSGLTSVTIGNSVTYISDWTFVYCGSLTSIVVDSDNPAYDSRDNCNAIIETASNRLIAGCMSTVIPATVTSVGFGAFVGCTGLTSVTIPNSVTTIGKMAFTQCSSLTSVTIPSSVASIGELAFSECELIDVYCYIVDPSTVEMVDDVFSTLYSNLYPHRTLHVLQGTAGAYQADGHWYPYFGQIVEDVHHNNLPGDVNSDGVVNITDVNVLIAVILGRHASTATGDVNGDGEITIADINAIVDILLGGGE